MTRDNSVKSVCPAVRAQCPEENCLPPRGEKKGPTSKGGCISEDQKKYEVTARSGRDLEPDSGFVQTQPGGGVIGKPGQRPQEHTTGSRRWERGEGV